MPNQYLQQLSQITTTSGNYLIPISDSPNGSGILKSINITNLLAGVPNISGLVNQATLINNYSLSGNITLKNTDISGFGTASILNSGNFLQTINNLADIPNISLARINLGLGQVSSYNSGTIFLNSPLSGIPTAPTAANGTNTTQLATTAFVTTAIINASGGVKTFNGRTGAITFQQSDYLTTPAYTIMGNSLNSTSSPSGINDLILGVPGYSAAVGTIGGQLTTNIPNYYQISLQNLNPSGSTDFVVTSDNGNDSTHYGDFGINGSKSGNLPFPNSNAVYLYTTDNELDIAALGSSGIINFWTGATPNFAGSFDNFQNLNIANKVQASGGTFTGPVTGITASLGDNTTKFATTAFVQAKTMTRTITWTVDNAGSLVTSGNTATVIIPYAANVVGWGIQTDQSGTVGVTLLKQAYSTSTLPSSSAWCAGAALPNVSGGVSNNSSTGLNYGAISANDQITLVISGAISNVTRVITELYLSASA